MKNIIYVINDFFLFLAILIIQTIKSKKESGAPAKFIITIIGFTSTHLGLFFIFSKS